MTSIPKVGCKAETNPATVVMMNNSYWEAGVMIFSEPFLAYSSFTSLMQYEIQWYHIIWSIVMPLQSDEECGTKREL